MESLANKDSNEGMEVFRIDLGDLTYGELCKSAGRIAILLQSAKTRTNAALAACLDDFLGAVYALIYAKQRAFTDRSSCPIDVGVVITRAKQLAKGEVRTDGKWMAGFYFNSALFRTSAVYDRMLKIVGGSNGDVGARRLEAEKLYRGWTGGEWQNRNLRAIHGQVNDLKHVPKGTYDRRREGAGYQSAVSAIEEMLDLIELWTAH